MDGAGFEGMRRRTVPVESCQRTLNGSTEQFVKTMKSLFDYYESRTEISVGGIQTSTVTEELFTVLEDTFQTCGEVDDIVIKIDPKSNLIRSCVVILRGENAKEKASLFKGCEVEGKKLTFTLVERTDGLTTSVQAARCVADFQKKRSEAISVTGYDFSLAKEDVKSALFSHFSSCGTITDIHVLDSHSIVHLYELGSVHRAVQLNGTDLGGFKLTVEVMPYQDEDESESSGGTRDDDSVIWIPNPNPIFL